MLEIQCFPGRYLLRCWRGYVTRSSIGIPIRRYPQPLSRCFTVANFQAFAIFITHTSFRLYHAFFPKSYLQSLHDTGSVHQEIQLSASRLYDMCDPDERGQWLDVLIAMIEYLRSGESKVGCLNNSVEKNMLHKENEVHFEESVNGEHGSGKIGEGDVGDVAGESLGEGETVVGLRRSMRKRKAESSEDRRVMVKSRKR